MFSTCTVELVVKFNFTQFVILEVINKNFQELLIQFMIYHTGGVLRVFKFHPLQAYAIWRIFKR